MQNMPVIATTALVNKFFCVCLQ